MARQTDIEISIGFAPQPGPQQLFLVAPFDIVVFGGARGGGKTYAVLGEFWIHAEAYCQHARGLMVRRTREDLRETREVAAEMFGEAATWTDKGSCFKFRSGAILWLAYLENDQDAMAYQGWSVTRLMIEELTQFPSPSPVYKLLATLRSKAGVPCKMHATCNPGGPGHNWVKAWIIDQGAYQPFHDPDTGMTRVFIPAKVDDNPALMHANPTYINKLKAVGSPELVRAWLEGDWNVIEGSFFPEFTQARHVVPYFKPPSWWTKFRAADWGSAKPFSIGWYAVVQDDHLLDTGQELPRGAIVRYREWYGMKPGEPNVGVKMSATEVAAGIVSRETLPNGQREDINYGVMDPSAFNVVSGPSIGEEMLRAGAVFKRADNTRIAIDKKMSGWNQIRQRLKGDDDGRPMLYITDNCKHLIRTLPIMQHDEHNPEDLDTDGEDHAVDELRYACMSRPYLASVVKLEDRNPFLVRNAFKLES